MNGKQKSDGLKSLEIKKDFYWVGEQDFEIDVFDIIMVTKFGTSYNSYILKTGDKEGVLFETVKVTFFDEYITKINSILGGVENIKYIFVSHTEPDHSGSIEKLLKLNPNIKIVASRVAINYLKEITNSSDFLSHQADEKNPLKVGKYNFTFISVPFLHWPDSMFTYIEELKTLVTCDVFGSHFASKEILLSKLPANKNAGYLEAMRYYFDCIFSPFRPHLLSAIDKIKNLDIALIALGHGPVLDTRINEVISNYKKWSSETSLNKIKEVLVVTCSAYGYTNMIAKSLIDGIKQNDNKIKVNYFELDVLNYPGLKPELAKLANSCDALLVGSCTINGDALPLVIDLMLDLSPIVHSNKVALAFGSYGWGGEGVANIDMRLHQLKMKTLPAIKCKFKPSNADIESYKKIGKDIRQQLLS